MLLLQLLINTPAKVQDIAEGIQYLHTENIIHGDLKGVKLIVLCLYHRSEGFFQVNILVDPSGRACLADFGLSAVADSRIAHWTSHSSAGSTGGSVRWQAPELNDPASDTVVHNSKESDVYAFSCVCYEVCNSMYLHISIWILTRTVQIFTACLPFYEFPRDCTVMLKVSNGHRPSRPMARSSAWSAWGLTEAMWELMEDCWSHSPHDRPDVAEIITWLTIALREQVDDRLRGSWGTEMSPSYFRSVVSGSRSHPSVDDVAGILSRFL